MNHFLSAEPPFRLCLAHCRLAESFSRTNCLIRLASDLQETYFLWRALSIAVLRLFPRLSLFPRNACIPLVHNQPRNLYWENSRTLLNARHPMYVPCSWTCCMPRPAETACRFGGISTCDHFISHTPLTGFHLGFSPPYRDECPAHSTSGHFAKTPP